MTVAELIELLQQIEDPDKRIMVIDTAAGYRDIEEVQDSLGFHYLIMTKKTTKRS